MRRLVRQKTRSTFFYITLVTVVLVLIFSSLFVAKIFFPNILTPDNEIISPEIRLARILDFERKLKQKDIEFDRVYSSTSGAYLVANLRDGPDVYFSNKKSVDVQVRSLQEVLTRLTIDGGSSQKNIQGKEPKLIDFRFDKPVVKF